jgi:hypothetical protein
MIKNFWISVIPIFISIPFCVAQTQTYTVTKAQFSSDKYDEFSPVFYRNGIVFTSNQGANTFINYSTPSGNGTGNIFYIDTSGKATAQKVELFSKSLSSPLNEGPVTFSRNFDTIYFARNLEVEGKLSEFSTIRNKIGVFSAVLENNKWTKVKELRFNNEWYNVSTPWLTTDGKRLFFASDKPGGFGGSDLYYCQWKVDYWDNPINLGPIINTTGNEGYPFVNLDGELFFSSDGHPGYGGKDIFFTRFVDTTWVTPVLLDSPINSKFDDFGIITDTLMDSGFFSSRRGKTYDIYKFKVIYPQIFYTEIQKENQYCFTFSDSGAIGIDTLKLKYLWDFGNSNKSVGRVVSHCFPGPGKYTVKLDIIDIKSGNLFFSKLSYDLELMDFTQPYINSPEIALKGDTIDFDGLKSNLSGYKILNFYWDFGDSTRLKGECVKHSFKKKGEFIVNLTVTLKSDLNGTIHKAGVAKKIIILNDSQERIDYLAISSSFLTEPIDIRLNQNAEIRNLYSAETDFEQDAIFQVELFRSKVKINYSNVTFSNIANKYDIIETFSVKDSLFKYIVDQELNLMETYPAYEEMLKNGFKDVTVKLFVIEDPAEKELYTLVRTFWKSADLYFDFYERLTSSAYIMMDQIVKLLNKYPLMKLKISVSCNNLSSEESSLRLSEKRSQLLVDYIVSKGINKQRLKGEYFVLKISSSNNFLDKNKKIVSRIEFSIIGN